MAETARIDVSSAGVTLQYAVETTAGTRPTSGYKALTGIKSIPDLNPQPSNLDSTTLDETEWKTYIPGLKDVGGAIQFGANNSEKFQNDWEALMTAWETANTSGKKTWFAIVIPKLTKAFYFSGVPSRLGLNAVSVDSVLEVSPYITPDKIDGWKAKPTNT